MVIDENDRVPDKPERKTTTKTSELASAPSLSSGMPPVPSPTIADTNASAESSMTFEEWSRGIPEVSRRMATDEAYRKEIAKRIS